MARTVQLQGGSKKPDDHSGSTCNRSNPRAARLPGTALHAKRSVAFAKPSCRVPASLGQLLFPADLPLAYLQKSRDGKDNRHADRKDRHCCDATGQPLRLGCYFFRQSPLWRRDRRWWLARNGAAQQTIVVADFPSTSLFVRDPIRIACSQKQTTNKTKSTTASYLRKGKFGPQPQGLLTAASSGASRRCCVERCIVQLSADRRVGGRTLSSRRRAVASARARLARVASAVVLRSG